MSRVQAQRAGQLLKLHWTTVYRLRKRFLADPVATSLAPGVTGPSVGSRKLLPEVEAVIAGTLTKWLPRQRELGAPLSELTMEIRRACLQAGLPPPSRHTVSRRWADHKEAQAMQLANDPDAVIPPGHLVSTIPLEWLQIDHTQADVFVVDEQTRKPIGRPWLSVAICVATRCVVGIYLAMERPNAATVALLLTRVVLPKAQWLKSIGLEVDWPMHGIPHCLHLDNAAEFKSKALRTGCGQYGIDLTYRPVGKPHFGGHVERMNRTLMDRLRGVPGATGNSVKGRKERKPEKYAALSLPEFENWLVLEIAQRYHRCEHRGLMGATPASVWKAYTETKPVRTLTGDASEELRFLVRFLPIVNRTIQPDGLTLFYIHYWHPIFAAWRESRKNVVVRYHPEDLLRVFVSANGKDYVQAPYADLRRPRISLWEQREIRRILRAQGQPNVSQALIFKTLAQQRDLIAKAQTRTRIAKRRKESAMNVTPCAARTPTGQTEQGAPIDYSRPAVPFPGEVW
jgi:putative transposase